jgi:hypothetical protein
MTMEQLVHLKYYICWKEKSDYKFKIVILDRNFSIFLVKNWIALCRRNCNDVFLCSHIRSHAVSNVLDHFRVL